MTLDVLRAELNALALAYPGETPVRFALREQRGEVTAVLAESDESGVAVLIEVQA